MPYGDFWPGRYGHDWESWGRLQKSERSQIMRATHQRERAEAARMARLRSIADDLTAVGASVPLADAHEAVAEMAAVALEGWTGRDAARQRAAPAVLIGPRGRVLFRRGGTVTTTTLPDRAAVGALRVRLEGTAFAVAQTADVAAALLVDCDAAVPEAVRGWLTATPSAEVQQASEQWNAHPMPGQWAERWRARRGFAWEDIGFVVDGRLAWHLTTGTEDSVHSWVVAPVSPARTALIRRVLPSATNWRRIG